MPYVFGGVSSLVFEFPGINESPNSLLLENADFALLWDSNPHYLLVLCIDNHRAMFQKCRLLEYPKGENGNFSC